MKILREIGKMRIYWEIYEFAVNMSRMENLQELDKSLEKKKIEENIEYWEKNLRERSWEVVKWRDF